MRTTISVLAAVALGLGIAGYVSKAAPKQPTAHRAAATPWYDKAYPVIEFGYIKSLTPLGQGYKLRLDLHTNFGPSKTGVQACIDAHQCAAGTKGFLDDHWDYDEKFILTLYLPPTADITLIGTSLDPVRVNSQHFYELSRGHNPGHLRNVTTGADVFRAFGYEVMLGTSAPDQFDTAARLHQVFHP
jgi:hypothetical protein